MRYFAIEYPNYTTLVVKAEGCPGEVLHALLSSSGITSYSGTIYNPKSFLTLREISTPDKRQKLVAQELSKVLLG